MSRVMWLGLMVCAVALISGCIPFPLVVPPARLTASIGSHVESAPDAPRLDGFGGHFDVRGALYPLHLWHNNRWFDLGLGYAYSNDLKNSRAEHGPFFDMTVFFEDINVFRPGVTFQLRLLSSNSDDSAYVQGFATALQISMDIVKFTSNTLDSECSSDACFIGASYGESGVGLYAEVAYEQLQARSRVEASIGLSLRTPFIIGVALVPIWNAL